MAKVHRQRVTARATRKNAKTFSPEVQELLSLRFTPEAPSVEELLKITINRREAFLAGQQAALFDELNVRIRAAYQTRFDLHGPDPSRTTFFDPDDPVVIPYWAADALYKLATMAMVNGSKGKGKHARWLRQYQDSLIHWHRYAAVKQAIAQHQSVYTDDKVYHHVANALAGSAFATGWKGIKRSCTEVANAIKHGDVSRFFRSPAFEAVSRQIPPK